MQIQDQVEKQMAEAAIQAKIASHLKNIVVEKS